VKRDVPEGVAVKFFHGRRVEQQFGTWYRTKGKDGNLKSWVEKGYTLLPRGGHTSCLLTFPDGKEVWGSAECSSLDNYSKKIGRDIALGRALKNIERREVAAKENT
jgi:hypothetical protein